MKINKKYIRIFDNDYEIIKETQKGVLIKRGDNQAWIMKRWINKDGELTKSAELALIEANYKRKILNSTRRKIDLKKAVGETDKAYKFLYKTWSPETGSVYVNFWLPKSQIKNGTIPEWLYNQKIDDIYMNSDIAKASISQRASISMAMNLEYNEPNFAKYTETPFGAIANKAEVEAMEIQKIKEIEAVEAKFAKKKIIKPKNIIKAPKPNAGIENKLKKDLLKFTAEMNKSLKWWILSAFKKDNPSQKLAKEFKELAKYWDEKSEILAKAKAKGFILQIQRDVDNKLSLNFNKERKTALINQIAKARINENIALIKSIPKEQILRYESILYNAVSDFDNQKLTAELQKMKIEAVEKKLKNADKITENRIKTIARDQTKKATEALSQARAQSSGFEYYIWITANDERVSTGKGGHKYLDGRIYKYGENTAIIDSYGNVGTCGERVNCRCTSGAVYLMPNETLELVKDSEHGDFYRIIQKETNS